MGGWVSFAKVTTVCLQDDQRVSAKPFKHCRGYRWIADVKSLVDRGNCVYSSSKVETPNRGNYRNEQNTGSNGPFYGTVGVS